MTTTSTALPAAKVLRAARVTAMVLLAVLLAAVARAQQGQVVVYVNFPTSIDKQFTLTVDRVSVHGEDTQNLTLRHDTLYGADVAGQQILLAEGGIYPDRLSGLTVTFSRLDLTVDTVSLTLDLDSAVARVPLGVTVEAGRATPIFLDWTAPPVNLNDSTFAPAMRRDQPAVPPTGSFIFVSNRESDNISVIDRFDYEIVDILMVAGGPSGMASSETARELWVVASKAGKIVVFDLLSRQVVREVDLRFDDRPTRIAFSRDERQVYVLASGSNSLIVLDAASYFEVSRHLLGVGASALAVDSTSGKVFVSSELSDEIAVFDPVSERLVTTYSTPGMPGELAVNAQSGNLLVGLRQRSLLSVIGLQDGNENARIELCAAPGGLLFQSTTRQLFAAATDCEEITIIKPARQLVVGRIDLPDAPGLLSLTPDRRHLMAVLPDVGRLAIINVNNRTLTRTVEVGLSPYQAVIPE